ncbi:MAG: sigma-54-dependent Fis family transcriptional regulator [Acidobacteria bacterium]|nr:sigma-54-dependent Fis family transcriptional regulator [Acidobacteriota bacterium]
MNPLITTSLRKTYQDAQIAATSNEPVLILGETGVGKEVLARYIHSQSRRCNQSFLPLNCSALPPHLIESELFGYTQGAFTGASHDKKGILEQAEHGTVLLDEIGDMPLDVQAKVLRVIETGEMWPVGSTAYRRIDVRFIAATNADVKHLIEQRQFRRDLYYRLNIFLYQIPPLRHQPEEIPQLADAIFNGEVTLSTPVLELFFCYSWPGNIRELKNVLIYARSRATGREILLEHLPAELVQTCKHPAVLQGQSLKQKLECFEAVVLRHTLRRYPDPGDAAKSIGMELRTLYRRIKKFGIVAHPRQSSGL